MTVYREKQTTEAMGSLLVLLCILWLLVQSANFGERVEGGPHQNNGPGLIFHCGRRPIFTMVEGLWPNTTQKACVSFNVHNDQRSLCSHFRSFLNTAGDLGAL